jgi:hypothetical protein
MAFFSKSTPKADNPWDEDARDRAKASRAIIINARARAAKLAPDLPGIKPQLQAFIEDLDYLDEAYLKDPAAFRKNRALTAVHLPGILTGLEALIQMQNDGADPDKTAQLETEIATCFAAAAQARAVLAQNATTAVEIEAAVLKEAINPIHGSAAEQQTPNEGSRSIIGQIDGLSRSGGKAILGGLTFGRDRVSEIGNTAADRLGAGAGLATTYLSGLVEDGIDMVTSPIARRVNAISSALSTASTSAIVGGLVTAVVFPPAVPFAVGLALLDGTSTYADALESEQNRADHDRSQRRSARQEEISNKLGKFRGRSPVIRMETQHVHVTMNAQTGQSQGIILTGRHAGDSLMDLDRDLLSHLGATAPDPETREIIYAWRNRMKPESAPPGKNNESFGSDALGLGLDLVTLAIIP